MECCLPKCSMQRDPLDCLPVIIIREMDSGRWANFDENQMNIKLALNIPTLFDKGWSNVPMLETPVFGVRVSYLYPYL